MKYFVGTIIMLVYSGLTIYIGANFRALLQSYQINPRLVIYWIIFFVISFSFIIARLHYSLSFLSFIGYYWMFVLEYGVILCIISNLLVKFTPLTTKLVGSSAIVILILLFVIGSYLAYTPVVHKQTIQIDKKGEPMKIVMASDFHLGVLSGKRHLERFVTLANEQSPDLVLLAGDIVDDDPARYIKTGMKDVMSKLDATYGVYGILGNHEYYGKKIPEFKQAMADSNVTILMDENVQLANGVMLTGREDITNNKRLSLEQLKPEDSALPWIVMNHTPSDLTEPTEVGADLHVSGHTHRGQLWPNQLITKRIFDLDYGYEKRKQLHAIVSSGFGFWGPPMRIGSQSELWVIDVQFTQNQ